MYISFKIKGNEQHYRAKIDDFYGKTICIPLNLPK